MSTVSYLDRFLEPVIEAFTPALARQLVDLRIDPNIRAQTWENRVTHKPGKIGSGLELSEPGKIRSGLELSVFEAIEEL